MQIPQHMPATLHFDQPPEAQAQITPEGLPQASFEQAGGVIDPAVIAAAGISLTKEQRIHEALAKVEKAHIDMPQPVIDANNPYGSV